MSFNQEQWEKQNRMDGNAAHERRRFPWATILFLAGTGIAVLGLAYLGWHQ